MGTHQQEDSVGEQARKEAFEELAATVERRLIKGGQVIRLNTLCAEYTRLLEKRGMACNHIRGDFLKRKLQGTFHSNITFVQPRCRKDSALVYSSTSDAMNSLGVKTQLSSNDEDSCNLKPMGDIPSTSSILYHSALAIRRELLSIDESMQWPITPEDICIEKCKCMVPDNLYNFLAWVLEGDKPQSDHVLHEHVHCSDTVNQQILSIAQDLIFVSRNSRVKTPKHVSLALTVRNMTGCSELVTLLNRFGHCVSMSQVQEIETAMAEEIIAESGSGCIIPSNIDSRRAVLWAWDNNDLQEETRTGADTTHCTTGIMVQHSLGKSPTGKTLVRSNSTAKFKASHKRTCLLLDPTVPFYNAGDRRGPGKMSIDEGLFEEGRCIFSDICHRMDFVWLLARMPSTHSPLFGAASDTVQRVPGWTAFNVLANAKAERVESVVGYLPVIQASPTELATVKLLLDRTKAAMASMAQLHCVVVLDEAIYAKAQEIVWKLEHRDKYNINWANHWEKSWRKVS